MEKAKHEIAELRRLAQRQRGFAEVGQAANRDGRLRLADILDALADEKERALKSAELGQQSEKIV